MTTPKPVTVTTLMRHKAAAEPIVALTAYDFPTARLVDQAGVDIILVGDSLGNVVLGYDTTLPVTMEDMLHHCRAVVRGATHALVVVDMPFLSYQTDVSEGVHNAGRLLKEGGAAAVKLEGGRPVADTVRACTEIGIPVFGHLGYTPQSRRLFGDEIVRGKTDEAAKRLLEDARALQESGAVALVLECMPPNVAANITASLNIPTIGIGAGPQCDGQILVLHDLLGLTPEGGVQPRFVKRYAGVADTILRAVSDYAAEVRSGKYPSAAHCYADADLESGT